MWDRRPRRQFRYLIRDRDSKSTSHVGLLDFGRLPALGTYVGVGGWRLAAGGWRLAAGGWRLAAGGWRINRPR
jgi:hypothetical protein